MTLKSPHRVRLGSSNAYLIPAKTGCVLVDAGAQKSGAKLFDVLAQENIPPQDVRLIVITHVHFDHVGGLRAIQERTGAPVLVHRAEADLLAQAKVVLPAGTNLFGRAFVALGKRLESLLRFAPYTADYMAEDVFPLDEFGLAGKAVPTPGHTAGSLTVLLDGGEAFVGDTCFNVPLWGASDGFPPFANDVPTLLQSWRALLDAGAKTIFPGHGSPFDAAVLRRRLPS